MPIEREQIRRALCSKGFVENTKRRDHDYYVLRHKDKKTGVFTKLSRGTKYKDYSDSLVRKVYSQIGLTKEEFELYLDCSLTLKDYVDRLIARGRIRI